MYYNLSTHKQISYDRQRNTTSSLGHLFNSFSPTAYVHKHQTHYMKSMSHNDTLGISLHPPFIRVRIYIVYVRI